MVGPAAEPLGFPGVVDPAALREHEREFGEPDPVGAGVRPVDVELGSVLAISLRQRQPGLLFPAVDVPEQQEIGDRLDRAAPEDPEIDLRRDARDALECLAVQPVRQRQRREEVGRDGIRQIPVHGDVDAFHVDVGEVVREPHDQRLERAEVRNGRPDEQAFSGGHRTPVRPPGVAGVLDEPPVRFPNAVGAARSSAPIRAIAAA